jgi:PAS domain S-box-containing protein
LGLTARLSVAFCTVVLVMVLLNTGYSIFQTIQESRQIAERKVEQATRAIAKDLIDIQRLNLELAKQLARDSNLLKPFQDHDRAAVAAFIKGVINSRGFVGFIAIADNNGRIFYSSDTPAKYGDDARAKSKVISRAYETMGASCGYAFFSPNYITQSAVVPFANANGAVIVSQPLNAELLVGEVRKLELLPNYLSGIDLVLLRSGDNHIMDVTSDLLNENNKFIVQLNQEGIKAIPSSGKNWLTSLFNVQSGFERSGRWWSAQDLNVRFAPNEPVAEEVGVILVSAPIPSTGEKVLGNLTLYGATAALAILISLLFSAAISSSINNPLRVLKRRASDFAAQKPNIPPLSGLQGEWLELGEKLDSAVISLRSTIASLKNQISKLSLESNEKTQQFETTDSQFDGLNKQISAQAKQITEVSKQLANANRQAVSLQLKLNAVLQSSAEGFLILDQYGNVLSANPVFFHWMGVTEAEIAGRYCFDLVRKPGEPRPDESQGRVFVKHGGDPGYLVNQFYPEGVVYHRIQPKVVEVLAHLQPIAGEDSNIQGYVMVLRDKSLRSELAQLRSDIVSMLSESIRAPIVAAETHWKNILRSAPDTMHPSVGKSLGELHSQYEHLLGMIDSLLLVYGGVMPTPVQEREPFSIQRLVAECQEEFGPLARERQLSLDYKGIAGLPNINVDRPTLKAVMSQLIGAMIDITASGGRVRVEVQLKKAEMRIAVTSSGPALADTEIADMFVGFIPGKHSEETYSSRLSMYLAGNNVERLGGKVWAESQEGRGTAVFLVLSVA